MKQLFYHLIIVFAFFALSNCQSAQGQKLARRHTVGIRFGAVSADMQKTLNIEHGVLLRYVLPNSSAFHAKLERGDVLVEFDGQQIKGRRAVGRLLSKYKTGSKIKTKFYRNGKLKTTTLRLMPAPKETSPDFDILYKSVAYKNNRLRTIISKPKGKGKYPAILLIPGIGCYSIERPFGDPLRLSTFVDSLTKRGFVTMRVEKTGMGDSKGTPCRSCTFKEELGGLQAGLAQLKQLDFVDNSNVFLFGWSMGGILAPMMASKDPVKGIVVYGTGSRNWIEYELENERRQQEMTGASYTEVGKAMQAKTKALHYLMVEKWKPQDIIAKFPETRPYFQYPQHYSYFQQVADVNPAEYWEKIDAQVLAIHGKSDFVSFAKEHALIAKMVNRKKAGKAEHLELENSDHWLNSVATPQESLEKMRSRVAKNYQLITVLADFVKKHSRMSRN